MVVQMNEDSIRLHLADTRERLRTINEGIERLRLLTAERFILESLVVSYEDLLALYVTQPVTVRVAPPDDADRAWESQPDSPSIEDLQDIRERFSDALPPLQEEEVERMPASEAPPSEGAPSSSLTEQREAAKLWDDLLEVMEDEPPVRPTRLPVPRLSGGGKWKCPDCSYYAPGRFTLETHRNVMHPEPTPPVPTASEALIQTIPKVPKKPPRIEEEEEVACIHCGEMKGLAYLASHINFAHPVQGPAVHVHRWKMDSPKGTTIQGECFCGAKREDPAEAGPPISFPNSRPKCPKCGGRITRDRFGYWCNACNTAVVPASALA